MTRFRRDLTPGEARRFWAEDFAWMALSVPTLRHYLQDHWLGGIDGGGLRALPFDGHAEAWYDNAAAYEETVTTPAWRALFDHGTTVFDPSSMVHGIVDEHVLRDGPRKAGSVKATWTVQLREPRHRGGLLPLAGRPRSARPQDARRPALRAEPREQVRRATLARRAVLRALPRVLQPVVRLTARAASGAGVRGVGASVPGGPGVRRPRQRAWRARRRARQALEAAATPRRSATT